MLAADPQLLHIVETGRDGEIFDVLVRMTGKQHLHIARPNDVTELGLLQLTQLQQLTELRVYMSEDVSRELKLSKVRSLPLSHCHFETH